MVHVEAHSRLDMLSPRPVTEWLTSADDTAFDVKYGVFTGIYSGHGLSYSADIVTGGTLVDLDIYVMGRLFYNPILELSGMNVDARQAAPNIAAGDFHAFLAVALTGDDTIDGSWGVDVLLGFGGSDIINGNQENDALHGGEGNDFLNAGPGTNQLDGGAGFDYVQYLQDFDAFTIENSGDQITVVSNDGQIVDTVVGVERIQFADAFLAFDFDAVAGQAYRIYQAAFDRVPDSQGLSYWINAMDDGMSLLDVSRHFIASVEFATTYSAYTTDLDFVDRLYDNILGRDGDAEDFAYWLQQLEGGMPRELVLAHFSESPENTAGTASAINDGILYYAA